MKFLIDMPVSPTLADWLNSQGHEAVHISQIGMASAPDVEVIKLARQQGSIVITADLDFPRLIALAEENSPAVILFRGGNYNERQMQNLLKRVLEVVPSQQIEKSIVVVDKFRIRKINLPIY